MEGQQYFLGFSVVALGILLLILVHYHFHGRLSDMNNKAFRKLIFLSLLDVSFDFLATFLPMLKGPRFPFLYSLINGIYFFLNVYLTYAMFVYVDTLKSVQTEYNKHIRRLIAVPGLIFAVLLAANIPSHLVFYYDSMGVYYRGPLYYLVYALAFGYIISSVLDAWANYTMYTRRQLFFLSQAFAILVTLVMCQLLIPHLILTDLGTALSLLVFYLYNNNPVEYIDTLTGALDKNYFDSWLEEQAREEKTVHLIAVRIANISEINAIHGVTTGNKLIADLANVLKGFDHEGFVFRLSGKCLMMHSHILSEYEEYLQKLSRWHDENLEGAGLLSRCRIEVAGVQNAEKLNPEHSLQLYIEYLFRQTAADNRRMHLVVSNEETLAGFRYELEVERFLQDAVFNDLFELVYQPIYNLKEQRFTKVEVLSRLHHPTLGNLNPQSFINAAEHIGLITRITNLQFRRLCRYLKCESQILEKVDKVSFNLSPLDLAQQEHIRALVDIAHEYEIPTEKLEFEITESVATKYGEELTCLIAYLSDYGISISLDDFGSGYANIANIITLPFRTIKIDRSLVLDIRKDSQREVFYRSMIRLIHELDREIVCEGIETREEAELLNSWGADMIQGWYFSKPVSGSVLPELLVK